MCSRCASLVSVGAAAILPSLPPSCPLLLLATSVVGVAGSCCRVTLTLPAWTAFHVVCVFCSLRAAASSAHAACPMCVVCPIVWPRLLLSCFCLPSVFPMRALREVPSQDAGGARCGSRPAAFPVWVLALCGLNQTLALCCLFEGCLYTEDSPLFRLVEGRAFSEARPLLPCFGVPELRRWPSFAALRLA